MIDPRMRALEALMGGQPIGQGALAPLAPISLPQAMPEAEGVATTFTQSGPSEYDALLEQARKAGLGVDFMRAGSMINEALTGAKAPMDLYAGLEARAQQPLQNLEKRRKAALEDPFSPETIRRRAALERANPELAKSLGAGDDTSWGDIEAIQGIVPAAPRAGAIPKSSDPKSPASQLAQARVRSILGGQLTEEDIANVTEASEADVMKYGTLGRGHEIIREGQLATTQRSQADREQRAMLAARVDAREWAQMSQEERLAMLRYVDAKEAREASRAERKEENVQRETLELSKRLENMPGIANDLSILTEFSAKPDVPGVGATGALPGKVLTEEGVRVRQAVRGVVGALLKEQSGAAVSEAELTRKLEELGMGPYASDREFRLGLQRLLANTDEVMRSKEAGASPEAVKRYRSRGGTTASDLPRPTAKPPAGGKETRKYSPSTDTTYILDEAGKVLRTIPGRATSG